MKSIGRVVEARRLELANRRARELAVLPDEDVVADRDVVRRALPGQKLVLDRLRVLVLREDVDRLGVVVVVEQLLGVVPERLEQHRGGHLAAAVDADVEQVLRVELEVEPRAAVRNDAGLVEQLAGRVRLALVVIEEDAGASVKLADDDALGAVDDERAVLGHQRDLAEVDFLLLDVADGSLGAVTAGVVDDELDRHLDRRGVGHAALPTLVDVVLRPLERVPAEHELARAVEVANREHAVEDALKTGVLPLVPGYVGLKELVVRALLNVDQIRDLEDVLDLPEGVSHSKVRLNRRRHERDSYRTTATGTLKPRIKRHVRDKETLRPPAASRKVVNAVLREPVLPRPGT